MSTSTKYKNSKVWSSQHKEGAPATIITDSGPYLNSPCQIKYSTGNRLYSTAWVVNQEGVEDRCYDTHDMGSIIRNCM